MNVVLNAVKVVVMNQDDAQVSKMVHSTDLCACGNNASENAINQMATVLFAGRATRQRLKLEHND